MPISARTKWISCFSWQGKRPELWGSSRSFVGRLGSETSGCYSKAPPWYCAGVGLEDDEEEEAVVVSRPRS